MIKNTKDGQTNIQLYVLGLLYFDDDTQKSVILSRKQLAEIGWMFVSTIFGDAKPDIGEDDTYFKFKLSEKENPLSFRDFIGSNLAQIIKEIQFGYYHHRAIFRLTFFENTKLHVIRNARAEAYRLIRNKCFDHFTNITLNGYDLHTKTESHQLLRYIYSISLIMIPNGCSVVKKESKHIKDLGYDDIFTTRSTTFGLYLPEHGSILKPKKHYIRISVPSTMIYVDGNSIQADLFDNIIDAVYFGGLYQKVKLDYENAQRTNNKFQAIDTWTNDLLLSVLQILNESVGSNELNDISVHIGRLALITAVIAIVISIIISLFIA